MSNHCPLCGEDPTCLWCGICESCHPLHRALAKDLERPIVVEASHE